ncbi:MAG TPA: hypothetical protein VFZ09_14920 [Archangium sp.]|uniref:hypothetical protein n=1 Tax=Archangium sp. TaxID=1872627 RepID=UPI002E37422D|nr:hypothetical protein [Archangium sp.]HEX5747536.1 hypothetical protein [Archangium sp.]
MAPQLLGTAPLEAEHGPLEAEIREDESAMSGAEDSLEHLAETYARTRMDTLLEQMRTIEVDLRFWVGSACAVLHRNEFTM